MAQISEELDRRLALVSKSGETSIDNLDVIGLFQSKDKETSLFAVAKDEDHIYGILETKNEPINIGAFHISILTDEGLFEKFTRPFNSGNYIHNNIKEYKAVSLKYHFLLDNAFRNRIINLHKVKSEDYLAQKSNDFLLSLGFSTGLKSLTMAIMSTNLVSAHKYTESGVIEYVHITGFLNLPRYLNIVTLIPLLSRFCFQAKDINDLYGKIEKSENSQLLCFVDSVRSKCDSTALNELVEFVNRQELNPNISEDSIDTRKLKKVTLSLNRIAYENIFSKYIDN